MRHVVLLGDSILDNAAYVAGLQRIAVAALSVFNDVIRRLAGRACVPSRLTPDAR